MPSTIPHGYFLPLIFFPPTSMTALLPTTANGIRSCTSMRKNNRWFQTSSCRVRNRQQATNSKTLFQHTLVTNYFKAVTELWKTIANKLGQISYRRFWIILKHWEEISLWEEIFHSVTILHLSIIHQWGQISTFRNLNEHSIWVDIVVTPRGLVLVEEYSSS